MQSSSLCRTAQTQTYFFRYYRWPLFLIRHSPFPIRHSPFPIPHSPFAIPHSPFPIPHSPFLVLVTSASLKSLKRKNDCVAVYVSSVKRPFFKISYQKKHGMGSQARILAGHVVHSTITILFNLGLTSTLSSKFKFLKKQRVKWKKYC